MSKIVSLTGRSLSLNSISYLFYFSCILGVVPYSLKKYSKNRIIQISLFSNFWCIILMLHNAVQYHFAQEKFSLNDEKTSGTLTIAIGLFIIYMEPFMMVVDIIAGIINQKTLIECFKRIDKIDEKLLTENSIEINYSKVYKVGVVMCAVIIVAEISNNIMNLVLYLDYEWLSLWFLVTILPILTNSIARVWFFILVFIVREHFISINKFFIKTKDEFLDKKRKALNDSGHVAIKNDLENRRNFETIGYLGEEIFMTRQSNTFLKRNRVYNGDKLQKDRRGVIQVAPFRDQIKSKTVLEPGGNTLDGRTNEFMVGDKMDKKLINLCQMHDEICEIGKLVNKMYSFQMLITMAFGFMNITAQFYFLYVGLADQLVPKLFRSAESVPLTVCYICYTASKCVSIIYISWKTKVEAQKTGIQIHKIANVVDENHFYHIINHLSLKLLNHQLNFTACGFFDLDMTTVYAITGAITSYLIILIQFNIAAQRTKSKDTNSTMSGLDNVTSTTTAIAKIFTTFSITEAPFLSTTPSGRTVRVN